MRMLRPAPNELLLVPAPEADGWRAPANRCLPFKAPFPRWASMSRCPGGSDRQAADRPRTASRLVMAWSLLGIRRSSEAICSRRVTPRRRILDWRTDQHGRRRCLHGTASSRELKVNTPPCPFRQWSGRPGDSREAATHSKKRGTRQVDKAEHLSLPARHRPLSVLMVSLTSTPCCAAVSSRM